MALAHRQDDLRACGATTEVIGQSSVTIHGKLWAVEGDICSHKGGNLLHSVNSVTINGKPIIVNKADVTTVNCITPLHLAPMENQTASSCNSVDVGN